MTGDFGDWDALLRSWGRSMRARNLAARTIELYTYAGRQLADYVMAHDGPAEGQHVWAAGWYRSGTIPGWL